MIRNSRSSTSQLPALVSEVLVLNHHQLPHPLEKLVLPIDKPAGISSFGVIRQLRRTLGIRKIGHAGTLDPLATGLLICCVGRATKLVNAFMDLEKKYTGTIRLGVETTTYDAEGDVVNRRDWENISDDDILATMSRFVGSIKQMAPIYSAIKIRGERLYKRARRGENVARPPRNVDIYEFVFLSRKDCDVNFSVRCSKGTYVRSLAHDVGQELGCGAHLVNLKRTGTGDISVNDAWTLDELEKATMG